MKLVFFVVFLVASLFASGSLAQTPAPSLGADAMFEKKDSQGRLISRVTFRPDGTMTHLAVAFGLESEKLTVQEDLDQKRDAVRRLREQTDRRGRPLEREETTFEGGRRVTKHTKFTYDAHGRQTSETKITE